MTIGELIQVILMGLLVIVTVIYAWRTFAISNATKKQANASVRMAEATEKSVAEMVRPMIEPSVEFDHIQDTESRQYYIDKMIAKFKNIGRGPALNLKTKIRYPYFKFEGSPFKTILEVGDESLITINRCEKEGHERFELIVKYQNMHGKWFCTELTQDEQGQYHSEYRELEGENND